MEYKWFAEGTIDQMEVAVIVNNERFKDCKMTTIGALEEKIGDKYPKYVAVDCQHPTKDGRIALISFHAAGLRHNSKCQSKSTYHLPIALQS